LCKSPKIDDFGPNRPRTAITTGKTMNDKTEELRRLMQKQGWTVQDVCALLPIDGNPRSYHTVYGWTMDSQPATIPGDCLEILKLRIRLAKCEEKLKTAPATDVASTQRPANRRR